MLSIQTLALHMPWATRMHSHTSAAYWQKFETPTTPRRTNTSFCIGPRKFTKALQHNQPEPNCHSHTTMAHYSPKSGGLAHALR